jgi:hypothetical protein
MIFGKNKSTKKATVSNGCCNFDTPFRKKEVSQRTQRNAMGEKAKS